MIKISQEMLNEVEKILAEVIGLKASSLGKQDIPRALMERMASEKESDEKLYLRKLKSSPKEIQELIELIVVGETWFFRNESTFDHFKEFVRGWKKEHPNKKIRVLSIPCASGEEPYSIAITLLEMGLAPREFLIDGIDISEYLLTKGKMGVYRKRAFRNQNQDLRDKFFRKSDEYEGYVLDDKVKGAVKLYKGNIFDKTLKTSSLKYDVIFCRNLLIYIHTKGQKEALERIKQVLDHNGILFVGPGDCEVVRAYGFNKINYPNSFAFSLS